MYTNPEKYIEQVQSQVDHLCISDQQVIQDPDNAEQILRHLKEAFRPGIKGNIADIRLVTKAWGFEPQQIKVPVEIWHGVEDTLAPIDEIKKRGYNLDIKNPHQEVDTLANPEVLLEEYRVTEKKISSILFFFYFEI